MRRNDELLRALSRAEVAFVNGAIERTFEAGRERRADAREMRRLLQEAIRRTGGQARAAREELGRRGLLPRACYMDPWQIAAVDDAERRHPEEPPAGGPRGPEDEPCDGEYA